MSTRDEERTPTLLVLCQANVCRSPLAQQLLRLTFSGSGWLGSVDVTSAGVATQVGWRMCETASSALGPDEESVRFIREHRSRPVARELVMGAHLILTMERAQRASIAQAYPGSQAKIFTLPEAAVLSNLILRQVQSGESAAPGTLGELSRRLQLVRGMAPVPAQKPRRWGRPSEQVDDPLTIVDGHSLNTRAHRSAIGAVLDATYSFADSTTAIARASVSR